MKRLTLIIIASLLSNVLFGQSADDMGVLPIPDKFNDYVYEREMNDIYDGATALDLIVKNAKIDVPWIVYSDRNENGLYDAADGFKSDKELDIGDRLHVFEVKGSWLKVGWVSREAREWKKEIKGWIKADKLILSPYAVLGAAGGPKKGMILTSVSDFNPDDDLTEILSKKHFYKDPKCEENDKSGNKARKFEFLFILKSNNHSVLMSYSDNLSLTNQSKSNIRGWLPHGKVTKWEHRVCLEPSSSAEAVRVYKGKKLYVIDTEAHFDRFLEQGSLPNDEWAIREIELINRRPFALQMRMPILPWKYETAKRKRVAAIAQMVTKPVECDCPDGTQSEECCDEQEKKSRTEIDLQDILAKATTKLSNIKTKMNTINLLFVLDGTRSMKNYGPAMARSIKEVILTKKSEGTNDQYRFGLAIYRHYDDEKDGRLFEFIPLQGEEHDILEKLESINYNSKNKVHQESHYYGMKEAIKRAKFDKKQTNIIVLVGDAGNIKNDKRGIKKDEIINLLYEKNISLLSYQVNFLNNAAYGAFNMDVYSYLKKTGLKHVKDSPFYKNCAFEDLGDNTIKLTFESKKVKDAYEEDLIPMFGKFKYANRGDKINVNLFESNLQNSLTEYLDMLEQLEGKLRSVIDLEAPEKANELLNEEDGEPLDVFTEAFVEFLRKQGFSDMDIEILKRQGEISAHGFLSLRTGGIDVDAFFPVIFISKDFKDVLNKRLETLAGRPNATGAEARAYLYNSMVNIVKAIMGEETSIQMIEKKTFNEIWLQILGVEFAGNSFLKGMEIYKIKTELNNDQFMDFYIDFAEQVDEFIQAEYDDDFSRWEKAGQTYYWIPLTDVPGCE